MTLSKAAQRERETLEELGQVIATLYAASGKFRMDSTGISLSGKLSAAALIIADVMDTVESRTS